MPDDDHSTHACTPNALFVNRQNDSWKSITIALCLAKKRCHTKPYMNNNNNIRWLFFRGIQEYIALDANNIARVEAG